jgi:hypothetical protein
MNLIEDARKYVAATMGKVALVDTARTDGRRCIVAALDIVLSDPNNLRLFMEQAETSFQENPLEFIANLARLGIMRAVTHTPESESEADDDQDLQVHVYLPDNGRGAKDGCNHSDRD